MNRGKIWAYGGRFKGQLLFLHCFLGSLFDYKNFWSKFSVCFQIENVYNATVLENILMKSNISESEEKIAIQALRECKLLDRVNDMRFGIYTVLSKEFNDDGRCYLVEKSKNYFLPECM